METTDKSLIENQITGLEARIKELRGHKELFSRAQGMDIEAEKLKGEYQKSKDSIESLKKLVAEKQAQKRVALSPVIAGLAGQMARFIASGYPKVELTEEGKLFIGWIRDPTVDPRLHEIPYDGLSGGEKVIMNTALAKALGATVLVVEAAEVDDKALGLLLDKYAESGVEQIIVSTCHAPEVVSAEWEVVQL